MADIDVQRKRTSIWPWILGLFLLLLLGWAVMELFENDEVDVAGDPAVAPMPATTTPTAAGAELPAAVTAYLTQCASEQGVPAGEMGLGHEFTVECLQQLQAGISAVASGQQVADASVGERMQELESTVQELQQSDTTASTHAELTRGAASLSSEVMRAMQTAWFSADAEVGDAVDAVQEAATGVDASTPMLEQRESVHTFFRAAGDALRVMAGQR